MSSIYCLFFVFFSIKSFAKFSVSALSVVTIINGLLRVDKIYRLMSKDCLILLHNMNISQFQGIGFTC